MFRMLLLVMFALIGCLDQQNGLKLDKEESKLDSAELEKAFAELQSCTNGRYDSQEVTAMIDFAKELQTYPKADLREALDGFYGTKGPNSFNLEEDAKTFILLRIYFGVPEQIQKSSAKFFGGFVFPENNSEIYYNFVWPLVFNNGIIEKIGSCGFGSGVYDVLGEFDFFDSTFGVRDLSGY